MPDRESSRARVKQRRLRLWHLVVVVFVTAMVFGAIRLLSSDPTVLGGLGGFVALLLGVTFFLATIHLGVMLGGRTTRGLKQWGTRRGGIVGFCGLWVGHAIHFLIVLAVVTAELFLIALLIAWLLGVVSFHWEGLGIRVG